MDTFAYAPQLTGHVELLLAGRLVVAALFGALLGVERSIAGKHAGMRTYAMVSLGSALFVVCGIIASYEMSFFSAISPLAVASSIVVGIGFIGAGLAAFRGEHPELTTSAGLWVAAGIGMAAGFGFETLAFFASVLSLFIFTIFLKIENKIRRRYGAKD